MDKITEVLPGFVKMTQGVTNLVEMMDEYVQDEHK